MSSHKWPNIVKKKIMFWKKYLEYIAHWSFCFLIVVNKLICLILVRLDFLISIILLILILSSLSLSLSGCFLQRKNAGFGESAQSLSYMEGKQVCCGSELWIISQGARAWAAEVDWCQGRYNAVYCSSKQRLETVVSFLWRAFKLKFAGSVYYWGPLMLKHDNLAENLRDQTLSCLFFRHF